MKPRQFMLVAGEPSGDVLGGELVEALRRKSLSQEIAPSRDAQPLHTALAPVFFGAGGQRMSQAGVRIVGDMTAESIIGVEGAVRKAVSFWRHLAALRKAAIASEPDAIILIDFSFFNHFLARSLRKYIRSKSGIFNNWRPKIIKLVSPQVWASRPGRVYQTAEDFDLLLTILPFEKDWYAKKVPGFPVEFVGNPIVDRFGNIPARPADLGAQKPRVLLLPGSRTKELKRHVPVMLQAMDLIREQLPGASACMVVPNERLAGLSKSLCGGREMELQTGGLHELLSRADLAISKSGTISLECAFFGVPAVILYKVSWPEYPVMRSFATVKYIAMPNLLADEEVFPEFIQSAATPGNISRAALEILRSPSRQAAVKTKLAKIVNSLGPPGASGRAADAIVRLFGDAGNIKNPRRIQSHQLYSVNSSPLPQGSFGCNRSKLSHFHPLTLRENCI